MICQFSLLKHTVFSGELLFFWQKILEVLDFKKKKQQILLYSAQQILCYRTSVSLTWVYVVPLGSLLHCFAPTAFRAGLK